MTGKGHTLVGIVSTIGLYHFTKNEVSNDLILISIGIITFILGSTAPDWMEIRKSNGGTVINHRTWTHWILPWITLFAISGSHSSIGLIDSNTFDFINLNISNIIDKNINFAIFCFSLGGLVHLITDLPNPMGIPVPTPYHRFSLKLWKSGKFEPAICFVFLGMNLIYADIVSLNF